MGFSRVPRPETKILTLDNGDTLTVRKRLTRGEQVAMFALCRAHDQDLQTAMVAAYLVDWSLTVDAEQLPPIFLKPLEEVYGAVCALDAADFRDVYTAVEAHEQAMDAERSAEKNTKDGAMPSPVISPSLSGVTGA